MIKFPKVKKLRFIATVIFTALNLAVIVILAVIGLVIDLIEVLTRSKRY